MVTTWHISDEGRVPSVTIVNISRYYVFTGLSRHSLKIYCRLWDIIIS